MSFDLQSSAGEQEVQAAAGTVRRVDPRELPTGSQLVCSHLLYYTMPTDTTLLTKHFTLTCRGVEIYIVLQYIAIEYI